MGNMAFEEDHAVMLEHPQMVTESLRNVFCLCESLAILVYRKNLVAFDF
jgi:hypothetical protein